MAELVFKPSSWVVPMPSIAVSSLQEMCFALDGNKGKNIKESEKERKERGLEKTEKKDGERGRNQLPSRS